MRAKQRYTIGVAIVASIAAVSAVAFDAIRNLHIRIVPKTMFGPAAVVDLVDDADNPVRILAVGRAYQSATFLGEKRFEAPFAYLRSFDAVFSTYPEPQRVCMVGGGAYAYPKQLLTQRQGIALDVVEIDPAITRLAKERFFLDELIERFTERPEGVLSEDISLPAAIEDHGNLRIVTADGIAWLSRQDAAYDAVLNDAFAGSRAADGAKAADAAKGALAPGGIYAVNVAKPARAGVQLVAFVHERCAELAGLFAHVYVLQVEDEGIDASENYLLFASDRELSIEGAFAFEA